MLPKIDITFNSTLRFESNKCVNINIENSIYL